MGIYGNRNIFDLGRLLLPFFFLSRRLLAPTFGVFWWSSVSFFPLLGWSSWSLVIIKPVWELVFHLLFARFLGEGFAANSGANKLRFVRLACGANFVVVFFTEARRKKKNTSRHFVFVFDALSICQLCHFTRGANLRALTNGESSSLSSAKNLCTRSQELP